NMRGERALIARIRERLGPPPSWVRIGIGDDAAVVEPERNALEVLTTDTLVEGVHWDPRFCSTADVGHKSLAVNLSDLAAMGASPRAALLSLSIRPDWAEDAADAFLEAFASLAREQGVAVVGGNVTSSPGPAMISVTATGSVRPRRVLTRSGARPGDDLYVTGSVGSGLAGLLWLQRHPSLDTPSDPGLAACVLRYRRPAPRVRTGLLLGKNRIASACIDLSDGLADGVRQIAEGSGTGARLEGQLLPIDGGAAAALRECGEDPLAAAVRGGDDYELLFAVPPRRRRALEAIKGLTRGVPITRVGTLTAGGGLVLVRDNRDETLPEGFAHF
ncbi:MAG TPA: thiamine-phosphate kinase, partial [Vicinamibacterales bacterium]|nr:thiamine-phosphate kinase [Vicinamibacterales bacterium]